MLYLRVILPALLLALFAPSCKIQCAKKIRMNNALLVGNYDFGKSQKYQKKNKKALAKGKDCTRWVRK